MDQVAYEFGGFRFEPFNLRLLYQERVIALTGKSADTLLVLLQHPDTLVTKDALIAAVWPDSVVEENNLNQQISTLRRALAQNGGPELIETVPRRGYRFIGPVRSIDLASPSPLLVDDGAVRVAAGRLRSWKGVTAGVLALSAGTALGWGWYEGQRVARASRSALERGRTLIREGNSRGAVAELQEAVRLDAGNARAHSTLAHALSNLSSSDSSSARRPAGRSPSVEAAERGVALDPQCGECQGTLGFFLFYHDWQWARADAHFREAIRLAPNQETIRPSYAMLLSVTGRTTQALEEVELALKKRPYQVSWLVIRASILYLARRYPEAIAAADQTLLISNKERGAWEWRSRALFQLGRGVEAVNAQAQEPFASHSAELDRAVREGGTEGGLRKLLEITGDWRGRVEHSWRRGPWRALLNDTEGALEEVERAYEARRLNTIYLGVDPVYDKIRAHPRFQKVLAGMGLEDFTVQ
jgi:DNA-binding winged helix-turn-helix (wHTH) protein/Flp pilus assembly protein TadD